MKVTYNGPIDAVEIAETGQIVERDQTVEVPDELAVRLIEQSSWDAAPKDVLAYVGKDPERAAAMLRAELDGAGRDQLLARLAKLAGVEDLAAAADAEPDAAEQDSADPTTQEG